MSGPLWSPNGRDIAYVAASDGSSSYAQHRSMWCRRTGGTARVREQGARSQCDRSGVVGRWPCDLCPARRRPQSASRAVRPWRGYASPCSTVGAKSARLRSRPQRAHRLARLHGDCRRRSFALEGKQLRRISHQNDERMSRVKLGTIDEITLASRTAHSSTASC